MEGQVSIISWAGYVEDGSNDPAYDWVTGFEEKTGCEVASKTFNTSDEAVNLMKTGDYDVVSASGDASLRLIAAGDVQPVNTDLIPSYEAVYDFLKDQPWNTVDGEHYGVPHGYGANLLLYNTDVFPEAPTSWDVVFDKAGENSGKITAYDNPIYIADAAVYLMEHQPDLGIENPYALDEEQFQAAVDLLKEQRPHVGEYLVGLPQGDPGVRDRRFGCGYDLAGHPERPGRRRCRDRRRAPRRGSDRLVGHLDDRRRHREHQLLVRVARLDREPPGGRRQRDVVRRRGAVERTPRTIPPRMQAYHGVSEYASPIGTGPHRSPSASTAAPTSSASTTRSGPRPGPRSRADPRPTDSPGVEAHATAPGTPEERHDRHRAVAFRPRRAAARADGGAPHLRVVVVPSPRAARAAVDGPAVLARPRLHRGPRAAPRHRLLDGRQLHGRNHHGLDPRQHHHGPYGHALSDRHAAHARHRTRSDGDRRAHRAAHRVLHGEGRIAARAAAARHRRPHAPVGELPREGVRVGARCSRRRASSSGRSRPSACTPPATA